MKRSGHNVIVLLASAGLIVGRASADPMAEWRYLDPYPSKHTGDMPAPEPTIVRTQVRDAVAAIGLPTVRLAYIIPSNRTAQANAVEKMRSMIIDNQNWFRDQFDRHGFGPKTFRVEMKADGVTPRVHVRNVPETDDYLRGDLWGRTIQAASTAGITTWSSGKVWVLVPEAHLQASNGSITGGTALGASFGSGTDPGVAMLGSDALARWASGMFTDDRAYQNLIIPEVGPFPLQQSVSFPSFEGNTVSSVSSSVRGASTHEMSHAFGLPHDFRNDANFHGNLMGNGLRGYRGNFFPARYVADHTRLSYAAALALNVSRYFNSEVGETTKPTVSNVTSGAVSIVNGQISISFTASDSSGLAGAWLTRSGDLIDEMPLGGTNLTRQFTIPYFTSGAANDYSIAVFDRLGNKQSVNTTITPASGPNRAPRPSIKVESPVPLAGETVVLNAGASTDPESNVSTLRVEWDLNDDGVFDTAPTTTKTLSLLLPFHESRYVIARVSDPSNATAVSTRVAIHAHRPPLSPGLLPGAIIEFSWLSKLGCIYQPQRSPTLDGWAPSGFVPLRGNGAQLREDEAMAADAAGFYRAVISKANN
jgi:hypothetical protein